LEEVPDHKTQEHADEVWDFACGEWAAEGKKEWGQEGGKPEQALQPVRAWGLEQAQDPAHAWEPEKAWEPEQASHSNKPVNQHPTRPPT